MQDIYKDTQFRNYMIFPDFLVNLNVSETAKVVYVLLLNRARLSQSNYEGWTDKGGKVYSNFTIESLAKAMGKSESTIKACLKALKAEGLIRTEQQGACRPNRIYVRMFDGYAFNLGLKNVENACDSQANKKEFVDEDGFSVFYSENGELPF